ncbi:MAG: hypothetical protein ABSD74_01910 [Rhizomicrobium sp.]|jgi:hypothetical protein
MRLGTLALVCFWPCSAFAQSDPGLDRIPQAAEADEGSAPSPVTGTSYIQGDLTLTALRNHLVVRLPPPAPPAWETRLFFDSRLNWQIDQAVTFTYSGRFNLRAEDHLDFPGHENVRNDLREAYVTWQNGSGVFLELGRINLKSGVAEGFNPTDYFKTRAVVEPISADPSVLRDDRLGTAMLLVQGIWTDAAVTALVAPRFTDDSPPALDTNLPNFNPAFDRTNAHTRALIKANVALFDDVSPEALLFDGDGRAQVGANLTKGIGQAVIAYAEWSGGRRSSLAEEAYEDGIRNHVFSLPPPIPVSDARSFDNDLATGATYATKIGLTLDLEFDYHQAGLSSGDWRNWFAAGSTSNPVTAGELWFIRGYANDQQEPLARDSVFVRADWQNALVRDLTLTGFIDSDLHDGSALIQVTADYALTPQWSVGGVVDIYAGGGRTDLGSLPQSASVLARLSRYF